MNIQITGRHFDASQELQKHVTEKMESLSKFYEKITNVDVILDYIGDHKRKVEINVSILNKNLSSHAEENTMNEAINHSIERMIRQLKKENSKLKEHR